MDVLGGQRLPLVLQPLTQVEFQLSDFLLLLACYRHDELQEQVVFSQVLASYQQRLEALVLPKQLRLLLDLVLDQLHLSHELSRLGFPILA